MVEPQQMLKGSRGDNENTLKNCTKKILMNWIATAEWSFTHRKTFWSVKSSGPQEALLLIVSAYDEIPVELFKTLKENDIKVLHSICQQIWKTQQWLQTGKGHSSSQFPRTGVLKNVLTIGQLHSFPMLIVQFSSFIQLCLTLCDSMGCSTPGFPVLHYLVEFA